MAKVISQAVFGNKPYAIPNEEKVWDPKLRDRLAQIEKIMLPIIKQYEEKFPGNDEIWLKWHEDAYKAGKQCIEPWSKTIDDLILLRAYEQPAPPPSVDEP